jgi:hypothetical protein
MGVRAAVLALIGLAVAAVPAAADVKIDGPSAHGAVRFGQNIQVELSGSCAKTASRIAVRFGETTLAGPAGRGCFPVVTVPTQEQAEREGWKPGRPVTVALTSGEKTTPLTFWRLQPTGLATVTDPFEKLNGADMATGDALDLGEVHLDGIQSFSVRNLTDTTGLWEIRAGDPSGPAVARGELGSAGSLFSAGADGWFHSVAPLELRPSQLGELNVGGDLTSAIPQTAHLFLVMVAGAATINFVDLNGPGVGLPHRFDSERGFTTLFDGSSFDGWRHTGPGRFVLKDGAMRAEHDPQDRGWAWEWYSLAQYSDFVLRLRFKVEDYEDNGGVLLRHSDPLGDVNRATNSADEIQIQEGFENHTGGIAHEADALRLATNMVGQWNDLEVVAVGPLYVARINGTEVQRFTTTKQLRGFIAVENEQLAGTKGGHISYDDIRIHRCLPGDPVCSTR